jgi:hypothetical protein
MRWHVLVSGGAGRGVAAVGKRPKCRRTTGNEPARPARSGSSGPSSTTRGPSPRWTPRTRPGNGTSIPCCWPRIPMRMASSSRNSAGAHGRPRLAARGCDAPGRRRGRGPAADPVRPHRAGHRGAEQRAAGRPRREGPPPLPAQADEHQVGHPYGHKLAILPSTRPTPQSDPQVSRLCAILEPYRGNTLSRAS